MHIYLLDTKYFVIVWCTVVFLHCEKSYAKWCKKIRIVKRRGAHIFVPTKSKSESCAWFCSLHITTNRKSECLQKQTQTDTHIFFHTTVNLEIL